MTTHTDKWYYGLMPVYVPEIHALDPEAFLNRYRYDVEVHVMARGPRIRGTVVVWPSLEQHGGDVHKQLKALGFRWVPTYREWRRDSRRPYQGKTYTATQWLESCRKLWAEVWDTYPLSEDDDGIDSIEGSPEHYYNETGDAKRNAKLWEMRRKAQTAPGAGYLEYNDIIDGLLINWVALIPIPVLGDLGDVTFHTGHLQAGRGLEIFQRSIRLYQVTAGEAVAITHKRHARMVEAKADGRLARDPVIGKPIYTETAEETARWDAMVAESRARQIETLERLAQTGG